MVDREYYRVRAAQEATLAQRAERPEVRRVHLEFAERYQRQADDDQAALKSAR